MNNLIRLFVLGGLAAFAIVILALGLARNDAELLAPLNLLLFALVAVIYLSPTGLAVYRDCRAAVWIALVNILLGWTILGWFAALGWAVSGKMRSVRPATLVPPTHPAHGH